MMSIFVSHSFQLNPMQSKSLKEVIREQAWYRGQIIRSETVPPRLFGGSPESEYSRAPEKDEVSNEILDVVEASGFTDVLPHEIAILRSYENGRDILLGIPLGRSINRMVEMAPLLGCAWLHGKALVLCSSAELIRLRSEAMRERLRSSAFDGLLSAGPAMDSDDLKEAAESGIDIVTTSPRILYQTLTAETSALQATISWIRQLKSVVVYGLDLFSPEEACHLGHMTELLRFFAIDLRLAVASRPLMSPEVVGLELFGSRVDACTTDTGPAPGFDSIFWLPPLIADPEIEPDLQVRVSRRTYSEELRHVTSIMPRVDGVRRILVWHAYAALSDAGIRILKNSLLQCLASGFSSPDSVLPELECVNNLYGVRSSWFGTTDVLMTLGVPPHCNAFIEDVGQVLREGGTLITFVPEDPLTNLALRDEDALKMLHPPRWLLPRSVELEGNYLDLLFHVSMGRLHKSRLSRCFREYQERLVPLFKQRIDSGRVVDEEVAYVKQASANADPVFLKWPLLGHRGTALGLGGDVRLDVEEYWQLGCLFDGALVSVDETLQLVRRIRDGNYSVEAAPEDAPAARIPIISRDFTGVVQVQQKRISYGAGREVVAKLTDLDVCEKLSAYIEIGDFSAPPERHTSVELQQREERSSKAVAAIHFKFPDAACEMASLLWFFVKTSFSDRAEALGIQVADDEALLFARHPIFNHSVQELFQTVETFLGALLNFSYRMLNSCPCTPGCARCLKHTMRPFERVAVLDKIRAMKVIGKLLGLQTLDSDLNYKIQGLSCSEAEERYRKSTNLILQVMEDKLNIQIPVMAQLAAVETLGSAGVLGTYSSGENLARILAPLSENTALEVIAHEYAHNWQLEPSSPHFSASLMDRHVPHGGKIFLEGFAQWIAFKMDDFWGLADAAGSICLRKDDEYGDGFKIFNRIENEVGLNSTLEFAREGLLKWHDKILNPEQVLKEFMQ